MFITNWSVIIAKFSQSKNISQCFFTNLLTQRIFELNNQLDERKSASNALLLVKRIDVSIKIVDVVVVSKNVSRCRRLAERLPKNVPLEARLPEGAVAAAGRSRKHLHLLDQLAG